MTKRVVKFGAMLLGAALLSACVGVREHRGFVLDEQLAQSVQVGVDNKESVTKTLGRPTFVGQFDPNDWYYLSQDTQPVRLPRPARDRPDLAPRPLRRRPAMSSRSTRPARN